MVRQVVGGQGGLVHALGVRRGPPVMWPVSCAITPISSFGVLVAWIRPVLMKDGLAAGMVKALMSGSPMRATWTLVRVEPPGLPATCRFAASLWISSSSSVSRMTLDARALLLGQGYGGAARAEGRRAMAATAANQRRLRRPAVLGVLVAERELMQATPEKRAAPSAPRQIQ